MIEHIISSFWGFFIFSLWGNILFPDRNTPSLSLWLQIEILLTDIADMGYSDPIYIHMTRVGNTH